MHDHVTALDSRHLGLLSLVVIVWLAFYLAARRWGMVVVGIACVLVAVLAWVEPWLSLGAVQLVIAAALGVRR